jgi:uncharacterized phage protein gp47/JayE
MPETLPVEITIPIRDEIIAAYKRAYKLRVPNADMRDGTQIDIDARVFADGVLPVYAAAKKYSRNMVLEEAIGDALVQWCEREGVDPPRDAIGASGYVTMQTSSGGTVIQSNDELINEATSQLFSAITSGISEAKANGSQLLIVGKSGGTSTNLPGGTRLKWTSPRPGCSAYATVTTQIDGSGLTGGHEKETSDDTIARILDQKANPAASGNDAAYQKATFTTPSVAVQRAFTYPAILGAGTIGVAFTVIPSRSGASRIPSSAQQSLAEVYVSGEMPADDGALFCQVVEESAEVVFGVNWSTTVTGWTDVAPWPPYLVRAAPSGSGAVIVLSAASAVSFMLECDNADYTTAVAPRVGDTIGFYDGANFRFRRKKILLVTGTGPWAITVDTTNNASDTAFTPALGDRAMPWSDSLDTVLPDVLAYSDKLGPGEQMATFFDEGSRQKRSPVQTKNSWPSEITAKGLSDAIVTDVVDEISALEGPGTSPTIGTPGSLSYMLRIDKISMFKDV